MIRKSKRKIVISKALPRVHTVVDSAPSEPVEPVVSESVPSSSAAAAKEPRVGDNLPDLADGAWPVSGRAVGAE